MHQAKEKTSRTWEFTSKNLFPSLLQILPYKVKIQYVHYQITCKLLSFILEDSWTEETTRQSMLFQITEGCVYHIKYYIYTTFYHSMDWPELGCLMEVTILFDTCTYCILTLYDRMTGLLHMWDDQGKWLTKVRNNFNPWWVSSTYTLLNNRLLIGSYHEMFTYLSNYGKSLKMLYHKLNRGFFHHPITPNVHNTT